MHKSSRLAAYTDHIQKIHNQSENNDFPEEPKKLRFAPIII